MSLGQAHRGQKEMLLQLLNSMPAKEPFGYHLLSWKQMLSNWWLRGKLSLKNFPLGKGRVFFSENCGFYYKF